MITAPKKENGEDHLLSCLVFMTEFFGRTKSSQSLLAGLPVTRSGISLTVFTKAAARAGFKVRLVERTIQEVPDEVMPVIGFFESGLPTILLKKDAGRVHIIDPVSRSQREEQASELSAKLSKNLIYIKPEPQEERTDDDYRTHWFWGAVFQSRSIYVQVLIASILINIFALTSPVFIMNFYNRVLPNDAIETGWVLAIGAASIFVFDFVIKILRGYFIDTAGRRADVIVAQKLYDKVLDMRLGVRKGSVGGFANNMREFDALREFFNSATMTGLVDFPFSLFFIFAIWMIAGIKIALLLLSLYILVMIAGYLFQMPVSNKVRHALKTNEQKHGLLVETIASIETIRGVAGEGMLRDRYAHYVGKSAEAGQASRFYSGISVNFSAFIQQLSGVLIVLLGMYLIKDKEMSVGALMACVLLSSRAIAPVGALATLVNKYHQSRAAYRMLDSIMRLPVERPQNRQFLHRPLLKGNFQVNSVDFSYPDTHRSTLQNVSFSVSPGEKVAIVGQIGSGKSTVVKLLVNFYEPDQGTILVDGTDMRQIDPADLRRNIAYMGQDVTLMSGTVRDNIIMGRPQASDEAVLRAAELAGVHDFIRKHPMGYDALLGERGEGLSSGQRQAVALARTLLMETPILILDEPTNAMDSGTEEKVLRNLDPIIGDKTVIFVTHKPALLRFVSRLIVMDGGRVVLDGPRDQVLQTLASGKVAAVK